MLIAFSTHGWDDYLYWQETDENILQKTNDLIKAITRDPFNGIGKPEKLKGQLSGYWSRRITDEHRLVYIVQGKKGIDQTLTIVQCRYHYTKK